MSSYMPTKTGMMKTASDRKWIKSAGIKGIVLTLDIGPHVSVSASAKLVLVSS